MDTTVSIAPIAAPPPAPIDRPRHNNVTGKVRVAIDALVWLALPRSEAAKHAGMTEHGLYKALRKPPVKAAYLAELEVLRLSGRARRLHRLEEISEQSTNLNAAVNAIRTLDQPENEVSSARAGLAQFPGFVIHVSNAPVQQRAAEDVSAKHQAISTTYEAVVDPTHKPPHD